MKKVELLAPAGNYDAFIGAVNAGADAIYLGGNKFGARAYADNFSEEEVCNAIKVAHFYGRKVYLTVNTLIKEKEFSKLYEYMLPFYCAGLDGVIVQDLGAFVFLRDHFPSMEMHVSTQMTLTGIAGVQLLQQLGAKRIVPARELSLTEIREIKDKTGIDIECFIHGAMCYCYSGQCLFSSILGGRSGNRGRCAQPCRLPYEIDGTAQYPLSLKDMCTIEHIPELIEAGIDSFKIEGRMKKPEYAAGVTALYRKYIDLYYQSGKEQYKVSEADKKKLLHLYIRSEIQDGYYYKHNGKEMITLSKPSYSGNDEQLLEKIKQEYVEALQKKEVKLQGIFVKGKPAKLIVSMPIGTEEISCALEGTIVDTAQNRPVTEDEIRKQLCKTGDTPFGLSEITLEAEADIFMPLKQINELRRNVLLLLENMVIEKQGFLVRRENALADEAKEICAPKNAAVEKKQTEYHVLVQTREQLFTCLSCTQKQITRIYLESSLLTQLKQGELENAIAQNSKLEFGVSYPRIIRMKDMKRLNTLWESTKNLPYILARNYETIGFLKEKEYKGKIVSDYNLYVWNTRSRAVMTQLSDEIGLPLELNRQELTEYQFCKPAKTEMMLYGYIPLMVTANCIQKTSNSCDGKNQQLFLTDRYKTKFPVQCNCIECYNIIYNSVPLSLLKYQDKLWGYVDAFRIDFTIENASQVEQVLTENMQENNGSYTTGHYKRGVL